MQVSQERKETQDQRKHRYQKLEDALQGLIYKQAEFITGSRWGFLVGLLSVLPM